MIHLMYEITNPKCPKCGTMMSGGAPHSGSGIQWECHNCGNIITEAPPINQNPQ